jgi:hypothetical protein
VLFHHGDTEARRKSKSLKKKLLEFDFLRASVPPW